MKFFLGEQYIQMKIEDIDLLLSKLDKEQISDFIRSECAYDYQFRQRFLALGAGIIFSPKFTDYQSRVIGIIEEFSNRYGYVDYQNSYNVNSAIYKILEEADGAIKKQRWEVAIAILEGIATMGEEIVYCGDDSGAELSSIVDECFNKWHDLCNLEFLPEKNKSEIFELTLGYFKKELLKEWDWWWDWIKMSITLADTLEKRERIIEALDHVINSTGDDWYVQYKVREAQRYKLEVMSKNGTPEEQRQFMYANVGHPSFRQTLLQMAWDEGNYEEVLRLAKDGVAYDSNQKEQVNEWRKWELKIYRHMNDKENIIRLAQYFFFEEGRFGEEEYTMKMMYNLMKSTVHNEDWNDFVDTLIKEASDKNNCVRLLYIFTQEQKWNLYMEYLRHSPSTYQIDDAPKEVWELFKEELICLYAACVRDFFKLASNRNSYSQGVSQLRTLLKYGGKDEVDKIVDEQKKRVPRRPALIDELSKL